MNREVRSIAAEGLAVWGELSWATKGSDGQVENHLRIRLPYISQGPQLVSASCSRRDGLQRGIWFHSPAPGRSEHQSQPDRGGSERLL